MKEGKKMEIREVAKERELKEIFGLYDSAFPASEKKPFSVILEKQKQGSVDILYLEEGGQFAGLAITAKKGDLVLLDYFAIAGERRGSGIGSHMIQALDAHYKGMRMAIEIESTKADVPDLKMRIKRKHFYHKNGMTDLPFMVCLFGVDMEMLSNGTEISFEEYWDLYDAIFGPRASGNVKFLGTRDT